MARKPGKKLTSSWLRKIGVPAVLIPGIIFASIYGLKNFDQNYYQNKQVFPDSGIVKTITDGDTFGFGNTTVRLLGVNAAANDAKSTDALKDLIVNKKVYLEYDRYQDDKYGRILAWIWVGCESTPTFLPADYMHLSGNASNPGLVYNPPGCQKGKLVQEELLKKKLVQIEIFADRGELKYQSRLQKIR